MIKLSDFHKDFMQTIISDADSRGVLRSKCFFENVCETLVDEGELSTNYTSSEFENADGQIQISGYDYDKEREILTLISHEYFQHEDIIQTLLKESFTKKFKFLKNFYFACANKLYEKLEESYEIYDTAWNIYNWINAGKISKVQLLILSDGQVTDRSSEVESSLENGMLFEYSLIDIKYLYRIYQSQNSGSTFTVSDIKIPCLEVSTEMDKYESYLSFLSGTDIVKIYEKFGQRLFDQNVRTFLQFKGGVNKGLRNTIKSEPEMFFAYNNGITATATNVKKNDYGQIIEIENFQIVNGGQTTSAIYASFKKYKEFDSIGHINVQMKLSVVRDSLNQNEFVSKVSEYANTQNKVNKSDFFSNSPFHKDYKVYADTLWVASPITQKKSKWFYERVRGEYLNKQAYLTDSEKKQFQKENPKIQLIDKTFLSKSENSWQQKPYIVSKGAQYSFKEFSTHITEELEKNSLVITEKYFKDSISRIILFKELEKLISNASWYDGGHRAATVAYTISFISWYFDQSKKILNFDLIWSMQTIPGELVTILENVALAVYQKILNPPAGNANVSQWCKKEACWESIKSLNLNIEIPEILLMDEDENLFMKKDEKKKKVLDNGIEIQSFVVGMNKRAKISLMEYYTDKANLEAVTEMQLDILRKYSQGLIRLPSEKQSRVIYSLYTKAQNEGMAF